MSLIFRTRRLVKPEDLNGQNALFGGRLLSWIDEECYIFCAQKMKSDNIVTKYISELNFENAAYRGDIVEIGVDVVKIGRTSLTVQCIVRDTKTKKEIVSVDKVVFVAIDENHNPVPHNMSPEG